MLGLTGHLGDRASALVDGQLSADEADRAWQHVHSCESCSHQVQRETWLKSRLSAFSDPSTEPSLAPGLLGALYAVDAQTRDAWHETGRIVARSRRRTLAVVGAGSVSAAVLGVIALTGSPAGLGERPGVRPAPARMSASLSGVGAQQTSRPTSRSSARPILPSVGPVPVGLRSPTH